MAEEVKPELIKKTQAALSKYIKKPPLTDKLLKKPPFRFLHDIVTSVIKETGFLEGVFTANELVADNVKDRDGKVKFLTKLINAVKQATGSPIKARPGKIVAGLEADKTLELLQALAKGISLKNNKKNTPESNQNTKKKTKDSAEVNDKKEVKDKGNLKVKSPASSLEKQVSQEGQDESENGRKEAGEQRKGKGREGRETAELAGTGGEDRPLENGVAERTGSEPLKEEEARRSGRRRERSAAKLKNVGDLNGLESKEGEGKPLENGVAEGTESDPVKEEEPRRSGRRRERSAVRLKGNRDVAETGLEDRPLENGLAERPGSDEDARRSGRRREQSAARLKEGGEEERQSSRRRESSAAKTKEDSDVEESNQRRRRGSTATNPPESTQERLVNGTTGENEAEPPRRKSLLRKNDSQEKMETEDPTLKRPQTKRASSRSSKGPLKAFVEKEKRADVKEENEDEAPKKKTEKAPLTLGGGESAAPLARPPSAALERPRTARRAPPSARPPSARNSRPPSAKPGAPRARDRGEVQNDISKNEAEKEIKEVVVITEADEPEDKEDLVVVENPSLQITEVDNLRDDSSSVMEGVLIDSILETQSELEKRKSNKAQVDIEWEGRRESGWERGQQRLREAVQGLTRAAGPLGKLFAFLQEDVDLASRELAVWRRAAATFTQQHATEQKLTEETLARHRTKLSELDSLIEEQHEAIRSLKSSILTNDRKIQSHISRSPAR